LQREELLLAEQMCDGSALQPFLQQLPEAGAFGLSRLLGVADIQVQLRATQGVGKEQFGLQACRLEALALEVLRRPVAQTSDRPGLLRHVGGVLSVPAGEVSIPNTSRGRLPSWRRIP